MGNRAVITLNQNPTGQSLGIYLHWNGGPESVLAFAECAVKVGTLNGDKTYGFARFAQIVANFFPGTLSCGIGHLSELDCDNGDNGLYVVSFKDGAPVIRQLKDGAYELRGANGGHVHDNAAIKRHKYWEEQEGGNILAKVIEANAAHFPALTPKTEAGK